jgi:hypothetical protein
MTELAALLVFTDGRRDCIARAIPSLLENLRGSFTARYIFDDSGSSEYRTWLTQSFPGFQVFRHRTGMRQGYAVAHQYAWQYLRYDLGEIPWLFSTEDDFIFNRPIELEPMIQVLAENPHLAQLVLKRQPWSKPERRVGGVIEQSPQDFWQAGDTCGNRWVEHRVFWSNNPHLCRSLILKKGWPNVEHSEQAFAEQLRADPDLRFAFWGHRQDRPAVHHIGARRNGHGY